MRLTRSQLCNSVCDNLCAARGLPPSDRMFTCITRAQVCVKMQFVCTYYDLLGRGAVWCRRRARAAQWNIWPALHFWKTQFRSISPLAHSTRSTRLVRTNLRFFRPHKHIGTHVGVCYASITHASNGCANIASRGHVH